MRILKINVLPLILLFSLASVKAETVIDQTDPVKLVDSLSKVILQKISERNKKVEYSPKQDREISDKYILPYVDTKKMARYVMGSYWRVATPEQQKEFSQEFKQALLLSYSNRIFQVKTFGIIGSSKEGRNRVIVTSNITQEDRSNVKVEYRVYQSKKTKLWYIYDIVVENISMLLNYRKTYASVFYTKGIDTVILNLKNKNKNKSSQIKSS